MASEYDLTREDTARQSRCRNQTFKFQISESGAHESKMQITPQGLGEAREISRFVP
jgi:hypothetical protein